MSPRFFADQTIASLLEAADEHEHPLSHYIEALGDALDELDLTQHTRIPMAD